MTVSNSGTPDHPIPPIRDPGEMDKESLRSDAVRWIRSRPDPDNVWIFATGSLMWNPDFAYAESQRGKIDGWHRAFCLYSLSYRGCPERPGLVMGLAPGGSCEGIAFRIDPDHLEDAAISIWQREMSHNSYRMIDVRIGTPSGDVPGYSLTPTEGHPQYAVGLPRKTVSAAIACSYGLRGSNLDYFTATRDHLLEMGINDPYIEEIAEDLSRSG